MRKTIGLICSLVLKLLLNTKASLSGNSEKKPEKIDKTQVMVLGVYHFNNRGLDDHNLSIESYFTEKRQKEINELYQRLADFEPTKIFIERNPKAQAKYDSLYALFKNNKLDVDTLSNGRDEVFQISFKLAKKLGHSRVFCINAKNIWFNGDVEKVAERLNMDILKKDEAETIAWMKETH